MNATFITLALVLLAGLKSVVDWGQEIEKLIDQLAEAIKARGGADPAPAQIEAAIAASALAHNGFQAEAQGFGA